MQLPNQSNPVFESHIAGKLREKYGFSQASYSECGKLMLFQLHEVRLLAFNINKHRPAGKKVFAGELLTFSLLEQAFYFVIRDYEKFIQKNVFRHAFEWVSSKAPADYINRLMVDFVLRFPSHSVFNGQFGAVEWLTMGTNPDDNKFLALRELMMILLANQNPANYNFRELFDRHHLEHQAFLDEVMEYLDGYFSKLHDASIDRPGLFAKLKEPMHHAPDNLYAQLEYVLYNWAELLPEEFVMRLLQGRDFIKEDYQLHGNTGGIPTFVPRYKNAVSQSAAIGKSGFDFGQDSVSLYNEYKAFTPDTHWMPRVVLIAKNTLVWLDQLSKTYQRDITRLDQIPDEELDRLSNWGINSLWLIGLWERSDASRKIKHINGVHDAVASAYSLFDYEIAHSLGGEDAYQVLNQRAKAKGIRLASDMVPNHTGIFSRWMIEHPDYFIQTPVSPFPGYQFTGPNLSDDPNVEIRIEDGYYNKADAAVVFQHIDKRTDDARFVYHGNDGTNMPWNDTAQLDMLKNEVREAVISKIFEVARRFSIIRFDAAMTLVKKHFARLWYPSPGSGGDIPSRSDFAMMQSAFEKFFPKEFWREVVDRINAHMPETLLLAEAFWLMEGYFVRTLGMHRVYNSAFMHMLKNEENSKYRELITNTLEFEPEILKRYVNFMSNPDEETAINQFGCGDKYFGVCVLMCTLPGLPMFAHGQIEGFQEKYGMEYKRAYHDEVPQQWLIDRHKRDIFPLLAKRYLFSEIEYFNYFAAIEEGSGEINENVFAFTNKFNEQRVLVFFNNKYERTQGNIVNSYPKLSGDGNVIISNIWDALELNKQKDTFWLINEHISGLDYILKTSDLNPNGWTFFLNGFEYKIFWNFREVFDHKGVYQKLYEKYGSAGISNIKREVSLLENHAIYLQLHEILKLENLEALAAEILEKSDADVPAPLSLHMKELVRAIIREIELVVGIQMQESLVLNAFSEGLDAYGKLLLIAAHSESQASGIGNRATNRVLIPLSLQARDGAAHQVGIIAIYLLVLESIAKGFEDPALEAQVMGNLQLLNGLSYSLQKSGYSDSGKEHIELLSEIAGDFYKLVTQKTQTPSASSADIIDLPQIQSSVLNLLVAFFQEQQTLKFIGVNYFQDEWFFNKESFEELLGWILSLVVFDKLKTGKISELGKPETHIENLISAMEVLYMKLVAAAEKENYKLSAFLDELQAMAIEPTL